MQIKNNYFTDKQLIELLTTNDTSLLSKLHSHARFITKSIYSNDIYIRGLIEVSNYCKQGCYYCGINRSNNIKRYRLKKKDIVDTAKIGYNLGFRTFVLQGGEDPLLNDDFYIDIIKAIKNAYKDIRITLSIGLRDFKSYEQLKKAGADRFLLRHESANEFVFKKLHPKDQSLKTRIDALINLKKLGFAIGTGFMVEAPFSSINTHIEDIKLIRKLKPQMIGIGPFISHKDTIFKENKSGSSDLTTRLISILRIENPTALIPSTTALNSIDEYGRIKGILSGANVIMPNLSPKLAKNNYNLYDNKKNTGLEGAEDVLKLDKYLNRYGYKISISPGDNKGVRNGKIRR
ncbi:MAG: [FeFe] hydrogenase H-cluster radical SAM maturase HydE [Tissierellia bacterium]|nr:[FeFe] hydrogenase H-cluster radical SAM maturase HydE [Tissierellia bacterium]